MTDEEISANVSKSETGSGDNGPYEGKQSMMDEFETNGHEISVIVNGSTQSPSSELSNRDDIMMENGQGNVLNGYDNQNNKTNLIVNYLPANMTQDEVRALFSSIGAVESCKLVRDKTTGESLGYAFVKYSNSYDADKAIKTLNTLRLQNKTIKVSLARPSSEAIKGANLYICGLPKRMTQEELDKLFSECGKIITLRILYDNKTGLSRGVAFIRFDQRSEAEQAIRRFNGYIAPGDRGEGEPITVKFANAPSTGRPEPNNGLAYLLRQAAYNMPQPTLSPPIAPSRPSMATTMSSMNPLQQLAPLAAMSRLKYPASAVDLLPAMTNPLIAPAMAAGSGALTATGWCIFVYNLSPETVESTLWQLFGPFGAVQTVKIIREPTTGKCKGFGFVTMSNYEEAMLAIQSLNGFTLGNRVLQVSFKTAPNGMGAPMPMKQRTPMASMAPASSASSQTSPVPSTPSPPPHNLPNGIHNGIHEMSK